MVKSFASHECKNEVDIFMEVSKNIMCEIGELEKSNKSMSDNLVYYNLIIKNYGKNH